MDKLINKLVTAKDPQDVLKITSSYDLQITDDQSLELGLWLNKYYPAQLQEVFNNFNLNDNYTYLLSWFTDDPPEALSSQAIDYLESPQDVEDIRDFYNGQLDLWAALASGHEDAVSEVQDQISNHDLAVALALAKRADQILVRQADEPQYFQHLRLWIDMTYPSDSQLRPGIFPDYELGIE